MRRRFLHPLPRFARIVVMLAAVLTVAACASGPSLPLYTPLQVAKTFGFHEQQLSANRFRVGYSAPIQWEYSYSAAERRREADRLIALSYDLALLRAAQLAIANGYPAFEISERENTVRVDVTRDYYDPFFPYGFYPYWYYPHPYHYFPHSSRQTELAVAVEMIATLLERPQEGVFDAHETAARLRAKYPEATAPVQTSAPAQ